MGSSECNGEWVPTPKEGRAEKGRGATKMSKIVRARNKGTIFQPSWNENGLPIGKDSVTLMSYWGTSICKNIPITIDEWKQVPQLLLDKLFEDVVVTYKVHPKKKKFMMTKANIAWRNFKSSLSRLWIWDPKGVVREKPPNKYNFIKLTDWKAFVKARLTEKWEIDELAKNGIYEKSIGRGRLWKLLRTDKKGEVVEGAKIVAARIDYFMRQSEQGKLEETKNEDVLSKALGKKEHGGRLRGVGVGVTNTEYFGPLRTKKEYMDQVTNLFSRVKHLEREMKTMKKKRSKGEYSESEEEDLEALKLNDSEEIHTTSEVDIPQGVTPCQLALSDPIYRLVVKGKVHNFSTETLVHTTPIPSGYVRVGIDYDMEENTPLPVPLEGEADAIGEAVGTLVLCPRELIVLDKNVNSSKDQDKQGGSLKIPTPFFTRQEKVVKCSKLQDKGLKNGPISSITKTQKVVNSSKDKDKQDDSIEEPRLSPIESQKELNTPMQPHSKSHEADRNFKALINVDTLPEQLFMFYKYILKLNCSQQITIPIDIGVTTHSKMIYLGKTEIMEFLAQEQIGVCHMLPYMSVSLMTDSQKGDMRKVKKSFIGYYVSLILIITIIYYLDSLHNQENIGTGNGIIEDLHEIIDIALFQFRSQMEIATKLKMDTKWLKIKCPRQTNEVDCGYYVMRFMKEIISHKRIMIPEIYFQDCQFSSYDQSQLDEVRIEWVRHIFKII